MPPKVRGFILQPSYRIERRRPVIHLWGRLETGESFLVRDDRCKPQAHTGKTQQLSVADSDPGELARV